MELDIKVMYLNPLGTDAYDRTFAEMVRDYKYPQTTAYVTSFSSAAVSPKMTNLEYRAYESCILNETARAARYCAGHGFDALVIGCFYDPALLAAREVSGETIVVAPCQASIAAALNVANNFSIVIGQWKWEDQMRQAVYEYGCRTGWYRSKPSVCVSRSFMPIPSAPGKGWKVPRSARSLNAARSRSSSDVPLRSDSSVNSKRPLPGVSAPTSR